MTKTVIMKCEKEPIAKCDRYYHGDIVYYLNNTNMALLKETKWDSAVKQKVEN